MCKRAPGAALPEPRDEALRRFRDMLLEGMNSPVAAEVNDQFFASLRERARDRNLSTGLGT